MKDSTRRRLGLVIAIALVLAAFALLVLAPDSAFAQNSGSATTPLIIVEPNKTKAGDMITVQGIAFTYGAQLVEYRWDDDPTTIAAPGTLSQAGHIDFAIRVPAEFQPGYHMLRVVQKDSRGFELTGPPSTAMIEVLTPQGRSVIHSTEPEAPKPFVEDSSDDSLIALIILISLGSIGLGAWITTIIGRPRQPRSR